MSDDFNFYCLTENADGLEKEINVIPLPIMNVEGWWYKPYIYSKDLPIDRISTPGTLSIFCENSIRSLSYSISYLNE